MSSTLAIATSGAAFGGALLAAGVTAPSVVIGQMQLADLHMLKVFVVGSASSAIVLKVLQRAGYTLKARQPTNLGWLGPYDGNIIGGLLIGIGMTLTGSCPGTVFAQLGSGIPNSPLILLGGILGGTIYTATSKNLKTKAATEAEPATSLTISQKMGWDANTTLLLFEGICAATVILADILSPHMEETRLNPLFGGILIGLSQLTSVLLTNSTLGISSSYEEAGKHIWKIIKPSNEHISNNSIIFAFGTVLGSFVLSKHRLPTLSLTSHS
ncbi:hypothetical protein BLS_002410 [Venturia inaequalis]|uniref:Sulphur transport domain-containing protein n=1 Tax=Venturia inaequalis TaxID=5025 RepID=A0A8H3VAT3_VENIN|nr:hypothetical protein BLS_002410 [Venturia inaequalis]KAE9986477.1 hypothetical protein EG327_004290 [Venturia inaequalis]